ncbi:MAG TPA: O-antigen ligase family protein [Novosphingobium sp.]|nr:O-antigen ligase family protein [Novosphingobium sp.]
MFLAAMLPVLAVWAQLPARSTAVLQLRRLVAGGAGLAILPVILASGSRAGLIIAALALALVPLFLQPAPAPARRRAAAAPAQPGRFAAITPRRALTGVIALALLGMVASVFSGSGGSSATRLAETSEEDMRLQFWSMTTPLVVDYLPLGSGAGAFVETLKVGEPVREVKPNYVNHAHNDPLELALTMGLPGIGLMLAALFALAAHSWQAWRGPAGPAKVQRARLASAFLVFMALASIVDYPLRVPTLAAIAVIMAFWLDPRSLPGRASGGQTGSGEGAGPR